MKKGWRKRGFLVLTLLIGLTGVFTANAASADFSVKKAVTPPTWNGRIEERKQGDALYALTPADADQASLSLKKGQKGAGSFTYRNQNAGKAWVLPLFEMAVQEGNADYKVAAPTAPATAPTTADASATAAPGSSSTDHSPISSSIGWIAAIVGSVILALVVAVLIVTLGKKP